MEAVLRKMILISEVALYSVDSSSVATNRGKLQDSVVSGYGSIYLSPMSSVRKTSTSRDTSIALPFEEGIEPARVRGVVENVRTCWRWAAI